MTTHELKSWPESFAAILHGRPFDLRRNDRGYAVGDTLSLMEFKPGTGTYTGRVLQRRVTFVLQGETQLAAVGGLRVGYAALGLAEV